MKPISFLNSPSHSPIRMQSTSASSIAASNAACKQSKRVPVQSKLNYGNSISGSDLKQQHEFKNFSNELYSNMDEDFKFQQQLHHQNSQSKILFNNPASLSSSSLLLMIQSSSNKNGTGTHFTNKSFNMDENNTAHVRLNSKSAATKSMSNLNSENILNNISLNVNYLGSNNGSNNVNNLVPSQLKLVNSNTIQICSKFYDKSKFNVIGEQETLV